MNFNFLRRPNKSKNTSSWDNLGTEVPFKNQNVARDNPETENESSSLSRQEKKLAKILISGDYDVFSEPSVEISEQAQKEVFDTINSNKLNLQSESELLQHIAPPSKTENSSPKKVFDNLSSLHEKRLLATFSGVGFDNYQDIQPSDVENFLSRFPTPIEFVPEARKFLEDIEKNNSPKKYQEYLADMEKFKHKIFGKRQEYFDSLQSLKQKARKAQKEQENQPRPEKEIVVYKIADAERKNLLEKGEISGDPFVLNGKGYELTTGILEQAGLAPEFSFSLDNVKIGFSKVYKVEGGRPAVTAYVKTEKGARVCSYYRSNSQGVWRYLPDYVSSNNPNDPVEWYGKGYSEESLNLPSETQAALEIISTQENIDIKPTLASFCFAGTAKSYPDKSSWIQDRMKHKLKGDFYQETAHSPILEFGKMSDEREKPSLLDLSGPESPDFSVPSTNSFSANTNLYGQISVEHYPSKDGKYEYTFNRDSENRAWLGGIEAKTKINSFGLRSEWVEAGDYATPLYEYAQMSDGYGDPTDRRGRNYVCMWKNYLSKAPLIQKYLKSRKN